jgi:hypothetical protein
MSWFTWPSNLSKTRTRFFPRTFGDVERSCESRRPLHGFGVAGIPLAEDIIQGTDMTATVSPTGPVAAGTPVTVRVTFSKSMTSGQDFFGELLLGPLSAPTAVHVPITIHRN